MKKKNIIFLADSTVDLMGLYQILSSSFNIIWVVYHRGVYDALKESKSKIQSLDILAKFKLKKNRYFLITLHRPELVEYNEKLLKVLKILI